jgi:hypothetical protein
MIGPVLCNCCTMMPSSVTPPSVTPPPPPPPPPPPKPVFGTIGLTLDISSVILGVLMLVFGKGK